MLTIIQRKQVLLPGEKNYPKKPVWLNKKSPALPKFWSWFLSLPRSFLAKSTTVRYQLRTQVFLCSVFAELKNLYGFNIHHGQNITHWSAVKFGPMSLTPVGNVRRQVTMAGILTQAVALIRLKCLTLLQFNYPNFHLIFVLSCPLTSRTKLKHFRKNTELITLNC